MSSDLKPYSTGTSLLYAMRASKMNHLKALLFHGPREAHKVLKMDNLIMVMQWDIFYLNQAKTSMFQERTLSHPSPLAVLRASSSSRTKRTFATRTRVTRRFGESLALFDVRRVCVCVCGKSFWINLLPHPTPTLLLLPRTRPPQLYLLPWETGIAFPPGVGESCSFG